MPTGISEVISSIRSGVRLTRMRTSRSNQPATYGRRKEVYSGLKRRHEQHWSSGGGAAADPHDWFPDCLDGPEPARKRPGNLTHALGG